MEFSPSVLCVGVAAAGGVDVHGGAASLLFIVRAASSWASLHCYSVWEWLDFIQGVASLMMGVGAVSTILCCYRRRWWYCVGFSAGFGCNGWQHSASDTIRFNNGLKKGISTTHSMQSVLHKLIPIIYWILTCLFPKKSKKD